jgi:hypothetical protein
MMNYDSKKLSIVIPFTGQCRYRTRNLLHVVNKLKNLNINLVVVEQITDNQLNLPGHVTHLKLRSPSTAFNKNWLIRSCIDIIDSEYIWMLDADCVLDYRAILNTMKLEHQCIQPQHSIKFLTEFETQQYLDKQATIEQLIAIPTFSTYSNVFGATSYIINTRFAKTNNVLCDDYNGWGLEDYDIYNTCNSLTNIHVDHRYNGIHLWHPEPLDKQLNYINNMSIFESRSGDLNVLKKHILNKHYSNTT